MSVTAEHDPLLLRMADGRFHSGQQLAAELGISRTAVWKRVQRLETELGLSIHAVRGRGYRLAEPLELFDVERVLGELQPSARARLDELHVLAATASTNDCAKGGSPTASGRARAWLAEHQTAGRGRRGRQWISLYGENLYLSLAWRFELPMSDLAGLSLVGGIVVAEVLDALGVSGHTLKWPNDVLIDGRKLAGILVEVSGEADGPATAVIGVGINRRIPREHGLRIDQPWTDLSRASRRTISRNRLAGRLIGGLIDACEEFARGRLQPFLPRWAAFDHLLGEPVRVMSGDRSVRGVYRGITTNGAMLLETAAGCSEHHAGEVSLRRAEDL